MSICELGEGLFAGFHDHERVKERSIPKYADNLNERVKAMKEY